MRKSTYEAAVQLSEQDVKFLYQIYEFRCLSINQGYLYFYEEEYQSVDDFKMEKIAFLEELNLIEIVVYKKDREAIFLTNMAIEIIRNVYGLATNVVDSKRNVIKRGYFTAGDLKLLPRLIAHQVGLNGFVLDFDKLSVDESLNWKHYGEKHVSHYFGIRPDGLLRFYDVDIFLEQDMATESKKQLMSKWDNYRTYLGSKEHGDNNRKIVMLFIIDNIESDAGVERRKDLVRHTAVESLIDLYSPQFDMYVGTKDELLDLLFTNIIPTLQNDGAHDHFMKIMRMRHNYAVNDATRIKQFLADTEYSFMIYKTDNEGNLLIQNKRLQEFLVDDATGDPFSMYHKIAYHKRNSAAFYRASNRHISVIFLVESEEEVRKNLELTGLMGTDNVYYTTIRRLTEKSFSEAIFQFDRAGNRYHFTNNGLIQRVYE